MNIFNLLVNKVLSLISNEGRSARMLAKNRETLAKEIPSDYVVIKSSSTSVTGSLPRNQNVSRTDSESTNPIAYNMSISSDTSSCDSSSSSSCD